MNKRIVSILINASTKFEANKSLLSPSVQVNKIYANFYSRRSNNILRGRYWYREKDGQYKEFNESITVLPEEFKDQDEYKIEKSIDEEYAKRYQRLLKKKEKTFDVKLSEEQKNTTPASCEYLGSDSDLAVDKNVKESDLWKSSDDRPKKIGQDPYKKPMHQCIFCKHNIPLDYKNIQLLSQFVSSQTGIVFSQQVTGLCIHKYAELENTIHKSRRLGLMPFFYKETVFMKDPQLFSPTDNNLKSIPNNFDQRKLNSDDV